MGIYFNDYERYVEKKWANPTANLVNPITYADSAAAQHPFPASPVCFLFLHLLFDSNSSSRTLIELNSALHRKRGLQS